MKKLLIIIASLLALGGCASTAEYTQYTDSQLKIETAKYAAEAARYKAMSDIANSGSETAKIAALVAIAVSSSGSHSATAQLRPPEPGGQAALQWASLLIPSVTQMYSIYSNTKLGINQSNNVARVAESTNTTYLGMASKIQAPAVPQANIYTTTTTTDRHDTTETTTLSGTGVIGAGTYSSEANPISYSLTGTGVVGGGTYTGPTYSLSGTGVLGRGTYTNTVTNSTPIVPPVVTNPTVITPVVTNPTVITPVVVTNP
jgi:hypothetical protein